MDLIPLTRPHIRQAVKDRISRTLDSGWITQGPVTAEFEAAFARFVGCPHAIAMTSCTTGLEVALRALGIGPGDEVIVPDYTYPCTASMPVLVGATAVIVEISREDLLIDFDALEAAITPRTRAIMPVSMFGNPLDYDRLSAIREKHGIPIIEDAACSIGSEYRGVQVGNHADLCVFSFHPRKTLTTGEGGMITTARDDLSAWMRSYKNFGVVRREGSYSFDFHGTNLKVSDITASIGLVMMDYLDELLAKRAELAAAYTERLSDHPAVTLPHVTRHGRHSWQSFPILIDHRNEVIEKMRTAGIETQIGTHALHCYPAFQNDDRVRLTGDLSNSRYAFEHCLVLPMYFEMTIDALDRVVNELSRCLSEVGAGSLQRA